MVHNNYTKVRYTMLKYFLEMDGEKYENIWYIFSTKS